MGEHHHLDIRPTYLACEEIPFGGDSDAMHFLRKYGLPTKVMHRRNVEGVPLSNVLRLTGTIQLFAWVFASNVHPYTVGRVGGHLR